MVDKIWETQVKIARATLRMPDAIVDVKGKPVIGGPNKKEALEILRIDREKRAMQRKMRGRKTR